MIGTKVRALERRLFFMASMDGAEGVINFFFLDLLSGTCRTHHGKRWGRRGNRPSGSSVPWTIVLKPGCGLFAKEILAGMRCTIGRLLVTRFFLKTSLDGTDLFVECHAGNKKKNNISTFV